MTGEIRRSALRRGAGMARNATRRLARAAGIALRGVRAAGGLLARALPSSRRARLALVGLLVVSGAAVWGANYYLENVPTALADEYREEAQPEAKRVANAMHATYKSFDAYLAANSVPRGFLRNVDTPAEYRRRLEPVLADVEHSLDRARSALKRARSRVKQAAERLPDVPTRPLLEGRGDLDDAESRDREAKRYLREAQRFLSSYDNFVAFEAKAQELNRRSFLSSTAEDIAEAPDLEGYEAAVAAALTEAKGLREARLRLNPPPAMKDFHDLRVEGETIWVDYLERVQSAIAAFSLAGLEAADDDLLAELKRNREDLRVAWQAFTARSSLQRGSRRLGGQAEDLERAIAELGSGADPGTVDIRYRPPAPPPPKPEGPSSKDDQSKA